MARNKLLTDEEYFKFYDLLGEKKRGEHIRKGQHMMSVLYEVSPTAYNAITGTEFDPFYDDSKRDIFLKQL